MGTDAWAGCGPAIVIALAFVFCTGCDCESDAGSASPQAAESVPTVELAPPTSDEAEPPAPTPDPAETAGGDPEHARATVAELLDALGEDSEEYGPVGTGPLPQTLAYAIHDCDAYEQCAVRPVAAWDRNGAFVLLSVFADESGFSSARLIREDGTSQTELAAFDAFGEPAERIRARLGRHARLPVAPNLVGERSITIFSLDFYSPLVALTFPMSRRVLWIETTGLADREYRMHLMRPDGSEPRVIATRAATVGPCDGGGYFCAINETDPDAECTDDMLEAEGRLCVLPMSISYVALGPNGLLLTIGQVHPAGHSDFQSAHWGVMLPDDLRP